MWDQLTWEAQATHVMGHKAGLALTMMPCDVTDFLEQCDDCVDDLCAVLIIAWLKEPTAVQLWKTTNVKGRALEARAEGLAESLYSTVQRMDGAPNVTELTELNGQGLRVVSVTLQPTWLTYLRI